VKILFVMRSTIYVRNFESTLTLLAARGHQVHVLAAPYDAPGQPNLLSRLCADHPGITHSAPPERQPAPWAQLGLQLRRGLDALRYRDAAYADAPKLRRRAELKAPALAASRAWKRLSATPVRRRMFMRLLHWCDQAVPRDAAATALVREQRPDLVLVTPLVEPGSPQAEYLRAARALGIRTGLCVYSWDNLTNKGLIHDPLDVVTVWNEPMKREAVALHRVPEHRVVVTGAAAYDHWFDWKPCSTREAFCARVGLDPGRPYLLYLCSSVFIAPDEPAFVRRWIGEIRSRSARLGGAAVLIRPHPQNTERWQSADLSDLAHVAVWPREGGNPVDAESRAGYFDSIHHAAAVVGVNTSAQIESAIVGRGVYTWLAPEFRDTQAGTLHFKHLTDAGGGLVEVAADLDEHVAHLERAIDAPEAAADRCRRFVASFVRPHGVTQPAAPRVVAALEQTAALGPAKADPGPWWRVPARPILRALARAFARAEAPPPETASGADDAEPAIRLKPVREGSAAAPAAAARAYAQYRQVREVIRGMVPADRQIVLTDTERARLRALEPLWEADEKTIARLRELGGKHISGVRLANYRGAEQTAFRQGLGEDVLRLLKRGDPSVWVDEPLMLGGFAFTDGARTYNHDTLRGFRALSLLQTAEVLRDFRGGAERRTVWEIGGGWGGFAYQFKTLCPNVTYLITGPPEMLLMSSVYLATLFPASRTRFYDPAAPAAFWADWAAVDFAFAPESIVGSMRPPRLDLVVDMGAVADMTASRAEQHAGRAYALGSPYFLTTSPPPEEIATGLPVDEIAGQFYWPHALSVPDFVDWLLVAHRRVFWLGWRRLHA
jgi:hypothetical protein